MWSKMDDEDKDAARKYIHLFHKHDSTNLTRWCGRLIQKLPSDIWNYQEIMFEHRPDVIVETGTLFGASSHFFATMFDLMGHGEVISIDIIPPMKRDKFLSHDRCHYICGSSVDKEVIKVVKERCKGKKVMVILDSNHTEAHVTEELKVYSKIVSVGQFLIVEDTGMNIYFGSDAYDSKDGGPFESVKKFMIGKGKNNFSFQANRERKFFATMHEFGFLLRIK